MMTFDDIGAALEAPQDAAVDPRAGAADLLALGERALEHWLVAHGQSPTDARREGFRLLALQRQGAKDDPSFNACRETCRELVYHYNLIALEPDDAATARRMLMMHFTAKHLYLFIAGKLEERALGDFCCASRPLRQAAP